MKEIERKGSGLPGARRIIILSLPERVRSGIRLHERTFAFVRRLLEKYLGGSDREAWENIRPLLLRVRKVERDSRAGVVNLFQMKPLLFRGEKTNVFGSARGERVFSFGESRIILRTHPESGESRNGIEKRSPMEKNEYYSFYASGLKEREIHQKSRLLNKGNFTVAAGNHAIREYKKSGDIRKRIQSNGISSPNRKELSESIVWSKGQRSNINMFPGSPDVIVLKKDASRRRKAAGIKKGKLRTAEIKIADSILREWSKQERTGQSVLLRPQIASGRDKNSRSRSEPGRAGQNELFLFPSREVPDQYDFARNHSSAGVRPLLHRKNREKIGSEKKGNHEAVSRTEKSRTQIQEGTDERSAQVWNSVETVTRHVLQELSKRSTKDIEPLAENLFRVMQSKFSREKYRRGIV